MSSLKSSRKIRKTRLVRVDLPSQILKYGIKSPSTKTYYIAIRMDKYSQFESKDMYPNYV